MILHHFIPQAGILVIKPDGQITADSITDLRAAVEFYLEDHKTINGVLIEAQKFPGYGSVIAFVEHLKFITEFQPKIDKVALVSDAKVADLAEFMAKTFLHQNFRHFPSTERDHALIWLSER